MRKQATPQKATTTAEKRIITKRPCIGLKYFQDTLCLMAQLQKEDELLGVEDEETKEIFTSLYNNQVKDIQSGKTRKLLEFIGVLVDDKIDMEKLYTAVQTLRLLKFQDKSVIDDRCITFKSNLSIHFKTLDILQFTLRQSGVNKVYKV